MEGTRKKRCPKGFRKDPNNPDKCIPVGETKATTTRKRARSVSKSASPSPEGRSPVGNPAFLGEGSYGCVHKPSLRCDPNTAMNYHGKISKLMKTARAKEELKEYVLINRADPDKRFHLGKPKTCKLGTQEINKDPIQSCRIQDKVTKKPDAFSLIVMQDGGLDLRKYVKSIHDKADAPARIRRLWIELRRMVYGVKLLQMHNIMHHDLKYENIVYDEAKNRTSFIDFGLMENIQKSMKQCREDKYDWAIFHWSYPFETSTIQKAQFENLQAMGQSFRQEEILKLIRDLAKDQDNFMNVFFELTGINEKREKDAHVNRFVNFMVNEVEGMTYETFIQRHFYTVDVYGLGVACLQLLEDSRRFMSARAVTSGKALFMDMVDPNLNTRLSIDQVIEGYDKWLVQNGMARSAIELPEIPLALAAASTKKARTKKSVSDLVTKLSKSLDKTTLSTIGEKDPVSLSNTLG
jgi:serine/threonine protein kinase